jgi:hypothetical protein
MTFQKPGLPPSLGERVKSNYYGESIRKSCSHRSTRLGASSHFTWRRKQRRLPKRRTPLKIKRTDKVQENKIASLSRGSVALYYPTPLLLFSVLLLLHISDDSEVFISARKPVVVISVHLCFSSVPQNKLFEKYVKICHDIFLSIAFRFVVCSVSLIRCHVCKTIQKLVQMNYVTRWSSEDYSILVCDAV